MTAEEHALTVTFQTGRARTSATGLSAEEADGLVRAWSRCSPRVGDAPTEASKDRNVVFGIQEFRSLLTALSVRTAIGASVGRDLLFHGACLASPSTGRAVVLCAASGVGKTTATRHLGRTLSYLTDETAIVEPDGRRVVPFPKPLSLLGPEGRYPKDQVGPDELGLREPPGPVHLHAIAVLDRREDAPAPWIEPLDLIEALTWIVPQTSSLGALPRGLVTLCRVADGLGGFRRIVYREAEQLGDLVDGLLDADPVPRMPAWQPLRDQDLRASEAAEGEGVGQIARRALDCGIRVDDGRVVVLRDEQIVVLDGLGAAVWTLLDRPRTLAQLWEELIAHAEPPADGMDLLRGALGALRDAGLTDVDDGAIV